MVATAPGRCVVGAPGAVSQPVETIEIDGNKLQLVFLNLAIGRAVPTLFPVQGGFVKCVAASTSTALAGLFTNRTAHGSPGGTAGIPFREGSSLKGVSFNQLWVTNAVQAGAWLLLLIAPAGMPDFFYETAAAAYGNVTVTKSQNIQTTADLGIVPAAAAVVALAALATRRTALITALAANVVNLRIGDANTAAARGAELAPGQTISLDTTAAIYAYAPAAGVNQFISRLEILD